MFLETKVKMKGKEGDEILAELRGVPTSDKQQCDGHWDLLPRLLLVKVKHGLMLAFSTWEM